MTFLFSPSVVSKRFLFRKLLQFISKCALMPRDTAYVVILPARNPPRGFMVLSSRLSVCMIHANVFPGPERVGFVA